MEFDLDQLTKILQASISPVALISGVGLLILSLTNRFGRVTDRIRDLARNAAEPGREKVNLQIEIFRRRASLLRNSITCAAGCVLVCSILVLGLFASAVMQVRLHLFILLLFAVSLVLLIASLLLFLWDMHLSLRAVQEHLRSNDETKPAI